uniref:Uncharacterized protein n=1 Tax=viral metagenome TaxID=1070528 RepID=A0A6M3IVC5_9ZZZZ
MDAICILAKTCKKGGYCDHGKPHEPDCTCSDPDFCYDHNPPKRAWCEPNKPIHPTEKSG